MSEFELSCATRQGDFWEAIDEFAEHQATAFAGPERPVVHSFEYDEQEVPPGGSQMRGSSADQPRSSDDPMYAQQSDAPSSRSGRAAGSDRVPSPASGTPGSSGGGDRPPGYQTEERYWTDYLRIALPIAGLLLLLSVFWFWASSFIGSDGDATQTPIVAVNVTPDTVPSLTPTLVDAVVLPTPTTGIAEPTLPPAEPTTAPAQPTQPPAEPTNPPETSGSFQEGDIVIVNDNDVRLRSAPSIEGDIVDTLTQGTELTILSATTTDAEGFIWWNVSSTELGATGWIAGDFIEK